MNQALQDFMKQEVEALNFDLVEFRKGGTARRPLLDLRIDRRDGTKVSIDDCAFVSRSIEPKLDASGIAGDQYVLEVSSPGVERPLRNVADWRRFVGRRASVSGQVVGGRIEGDILALEGDEQAPVAVLRDSKGREHRVPINEIKEARLVFVWNK